MYLWKIAEIAIIAIPWIMIIGITGFNINDVPLFICPGFISEYENSKNSRNSNLV
jgi:hypothetical protein